jgi:dTMP kinase
MAEGWPVQSTRVPGGTPIGEELRKVMLSPLERPPATSLYMAVAIQEALFDAIESDRAEGKIILMDRGPLSMAAYEIYGGELDAELGWRYVEAGMSQLRPELTIIYSTDVEAAMRRTQAKGGQTDYFESQPRAFFERVANGYQMAAKRYPSTSLVIDTNQSIEAVQAETMRHIRRALDKKCSVTRPA